jgi:hypothetical protein
MTRRELREPRHRFFLNHYEDHAFTRCPSCDAPTRVRKHCLVIHVEPRHLLVLNKTCRYCPPCDLLIARRREVEEQLVAAWMERDPEVVGNGYMVLGTVDRAVWRRAMREEVMTDEFVRMVHPFADLLDVSVEPGGWWLPPGRAGRPGGR